MGRQRRETGLGKDYGSIDVIAAQTRQSTELGLRVIDHTAELWKQELGKGQKLDQGMQTSAQSVKGCAVKWNVWR
jgi:hypothetical protein